MPKLSNPVKHTALIFLLLLWNIYHFFVLTKYASIPWWARIESDSDASYAVSTVAMLNGGELTFISHPGATIFFFSSIVFRLLSAINPSYQQLLQLADVQNLNAVVAIIEQSVILTRYLVFFSMCLFLLVVYKMFYALTRNKPLTFFLTFYVISAFSVNLHYHMIRPELYSITFLFAAIYFWIKHVNLKIKSFTNELKLFSAIGLCLGFSVLSKIQAIPLIAAFIAFALCTLCFTPTPGDNQSPSAKNLKHNLILAFLNLILLPWWVLKRPDFLTPEYLKTLSKYEYHKLMYGPAPENLFFYPAAVLIALLLLAFLAVFIQSKNNSRLRNLQTSLFKGSLFCNGILLGLIIAVYIILWPTAQSLSGYVDNLRHMIYANGTSLLYGGFAENRIMDSSTFSKIAGRVSGAGAVLKCSLVWIVGLISGASLLRLLQKKNEHKKLYLLVLLIFFVAFCMDILGTMRIPAYYPLWQVIYSFSFYALGIGLWCALESKKLSWKNPTKEKNNHMYQLILLVFFLHAGFKWYALINHPPVFQAEKQNPKVVFIETLDHGRPFWKIVNRAMVINGVKTNNLSF